MPGFEFGFVEVAKGAFASAEKAFCDSFAASMDRPEPLVVDMVAIARDWLSDDGCVKVRAAMVVRQSSVEGTDGGADVKEPQGTTVEVVTVLKTVGRHEDSSYSRGRRRGVGMGGSYEQMDERG